MRTKDPIKYYEIIDVELGHVFITYEQDQCICYEQSIQAMGHRSLTKEVKPT